MSTQLLRIPSVTENDLRLFHDKHFSCLTSEPSDRHQDAHVDVEEGFENDGLGYYHDGVKRTLTDDQIAMFRHSEIQTLLRERRRRREISEAETSHNVSSIPTEPVGDMSQPDTAKDTERKRSASASGSQGLGKRKWQRFIETSETNPEHLTHRRIARELDEQKASSIDLSYGDEESTYAVAEKQPKYTSSSQLRRKEVSYDDGHDSVPATQAPNPIQDPKFIWPTLGAKDDLRDASTPLS
ncbi:hypothetical protein QM012_009005 [Aureobasidium pullulans]|uniref:Uncharacterized protein n=1 Tax=Aureobasidium pullulans TaxID=5580 RepID=A0ABR0TI90_AURPU